MKYYVSIISEGTISQESADGTYTLYHFNSNGNTMALSDIDGTVTDRYAYDSFGELTLQQGDTVNPFLFDGRDGIMTDGNGLLYMRARYYNPEIKRFMNEDTYEGQIGNPLTLNLYTYVENNPLTRWDPSGHASRKTKEEITSSLDSATGAKEGDNVYWTVRDKLGAIAQVYIPSKDNQEFIFLYNMAIGNHYDPSENTKENQAWAREQLIQGLSLRDNSPTVLLQNYITQKDQTIESLNNSPYIKDGAIIGVTGSTMLMNPFVGAGVGIGDTMIGNHYGTNPSTTVTTHATVALTQDRLQQYTAVDAFSDMYHEVKFKISQTFNKIFGS